MLAKVSRSGVILRNIASNWSGFAVSAAVTLLLTPFVLRELGEARYGVWVLTASIIGYYGLLDFGFRGSVNQYLTRYIAQRDYGKASECMSSAVAVLGALGALFAMLSTGAAYFAPHLWNFPSGIEVEVFWCILIVGLTSSTQFAFFPFMAIFTATQRFDLANLIGIATRLLTAAGVYSALHMGYGLIGVSASTCGASLIDYLIRWRVANRLAPDLEVSWHRVSRLRLSEMISFGKWTFLISVNGYIYSHAQTLLIGVMMPIAAVGYYALATGLSRQINDVLSPVGHVVYPAATALYAKGDNGALERLYHDGSRFIQVATICTVLVASVWAEDFYRLWIGEGYLTGNELPSVALLLRILLVATVASYFGNIAVQILMGAGQVRVLATLLICGSALTLTFSLLLIRRYGLIGLAMATSIASILVDLVAIPLVLQGVLGLRVRSFLRSACLRPAVVGVLLAPVMFFIRSTGFPTDWYRLAWHGVLAGASAVIVVLAVGVTPGERKRFLVEPLRRALNGVVGPKSNAAGIKQ